MIWMLVENIEQATSKIKLELDVKFRLFLENHSLIQNLDRKNWRYFSLSKCKFNLLFIKIIIYKIYLIFIIVLLLLLLDFFYKKFQ